MAVIFQGSHLYRLDDKGRLGLPADFARNLGDDFTITRANADCLWLLPAETWDFLILSLSTGTLFDKNRHALQRFFVANSARGAADRTGRITLPAYLRGAVGLQHEVMVVGAVNRVEIWDAERWRNYLESIDSQAIDDFLAAADL